MENRQKFVVSGFELIVNQKIVLNYFKYFC